MDYAGSSLPVFGMWVRLWAPNDSDLKLIGPNGTRIDPALDANWLGVIGMVVGVRLDLKTFATDLDVWLVAWRQGNVGRLVSPSAVVKDYDSATTTITLEGTTADPVLVDINTQPGFLVGDDVVFVRSDGSSWEGESSTNATAYNIASLDYSTNPWTITLTSGPGTDFVTSADYTDDAGNPKILLELADAGDFSGASWSGSSLIPASVASRRYAYISDTSEQVNGDTGDIYTL